MPRIISRLLYTIKEKIKKCMDSQTDRYIYVVKGSEEHLEMALGEECMYAVCVSNH